MTKGFLARAWFVLVLLWVYAIGGGNADVTSTTATTTTTTTQWEKAWHAFSEFRDLVVGKHTTTHTNGVPAVSSGISIIGAGFPRTGTKSIEAALNKLGHRIYDPRTVVEHHHQQRWVKAAQDWKLRNDLTELESLLQDVEEAGFTATLDMPLFLFALPMAQLRPKAKVLLSVRDSPEQWYQSFTFVNSIFAPILYCRPWIWIMPDLTFNVPIIKLVLNVDTVNMKDDPRYVKRVLPWYDAVHYNPVGMDDDVNQNWINAYKQLTQSIIESTIPQGRLLVFNVKQGWDPLLAFLDCDIDEALIESISSEGFPHVNDRTILESVRTAMRVIGLGFPFWILFVLTAGVMFVLMLYCIVRGVKTKKPKSE